MAAPPRQPVSETPTWHALDRAEFGALRYPTKAQLSLSLSNEAVCLFNDGVEILLVEDNVNDELLALHAFKRYSVSNDVFVVRDGAEALEYIFCTGAYAERIWKNPKLILLDMNLPLVDGIEVLRQLRSDPRTQSIPVAMLTASTDERGLVEANKLGISGFIMKPIDLELYNQVAKDLVCNQAAPQPPADSLNGPSTQNDL